VMAITGSPVIQGKNEGGIYNADAYGTHGSDAAVRAAVLAASTAGGGRVYLSEGTWTLTSAVVVGSHKVHIQGAGIGTTTVYATGGSYAIGFPAHYKYGGVHDMTITSSAARIGIYLSDGNTPSTPGGGTNGSFTDLLFEPSITSGIRVGVFSNWVTFDNIEFGSITNGIFFDTAGANEGNDNPTGCVLNNISGNMSGSGILFSGGAFGDLVINNVNVVGTSGSAVGIKFLGGAYYKDHTNISNVHMDGSGTYSVQRVDGMSQFNAIGITSGGSIGGPINPVAVANSTILATQDGLCVSGSITYGSAAVGTCDYVFDKDYKLCTIEELGEFIKEYGCLPGMTINSGGERELNKSVNELIVKIEEQARYIVELHNRTEELENKC